MRTFEFCFDTNDTTICFCFSDLPLQLLGYWALYNLGYPFAVITTALNPFLANAPTDPATTQTIVTTRSSRARNGTRLRPRLLPNACPCYTANAAFCGA